MTDHDLSRRDALKLSGLGILGAAALAAGLPPRALAQPPAPVASAVPRKRALRIAHLTDIHVQPERGAGEGLAACLDHVQSFKDKPDLIVTGGDLVMDSFGATDARTALQWELFTKTWKDHCPIRTEHTLGNHDTWGWHKKPSKTTGSEKNWGKQRALDALGIPRRYHSYDLAGWHIVHLDSTHTDPNNPDGYIGMLDNEQLDWLKADLASVKRGTHTLIVSHIPIFSITVLADKPNKDNHYDVPGGEMHVDSPDLRELFEKNGMVRACISGHIHRLDQVKFRGIEYHCDGAVCGSWWKGPNHEAVEGYALLDLFDDGTIDNRYVTYGWKARE